MNKSRIMPQILAMAAVIVLGSISIFGQSPAAIDQNYEATLHVLIGSDEAGQGADLPKSLDGVTRQIRNSFSFKNYRLLNTYYGRLASGGSLEYKSVSSLKDVSTELDSPTFLDWQLANFRNEPAASGRSSLSMQVFRFGARVPIVITKVPGEGKAAAVTNYESVGLTLNKLSVSENIPTLIGTISLPRTTGTVFLVMAIRPV